IKTDKINKLINLIISSNVHELESANARLRGWQRITLNSNTTTATTTAQWDWKRRALTVPLEAFVMAKLTD
ncbi:hypothetical protein, partial [Vibrio cholerae]|uniref:hypothetical protein n=1 Tax=Vibrio cholerae TaxID=666 RepID=UPI001C8E6ED7